MGLDIRVYQSLGLVNQFPNEADYFAKYQPDDADFLLYVRPRSQGEFIEALTPLVLGGGVQLR